MKSILFIFVFMSFGVFAHTNAEYSREKIKAATAKKIASSEIERLVKERKIWDSWLKAKHLKVDKKKVGAETEWVVTYKNEKIKNKKRKKLYVFINLFGDFLAANYTGN